MKQAVTQEYLAKSIYYQTLQVGRNADALLLEQHRQAEPSLFNTLSNNASEYVNPVVQIINQMEQGRPIN